MKKKFGKQNGKIKILHVIGSFYQGGTEQISLDILSRLDKSTFDIYVCSLLHAADTDVMRRFEDKGIKTHVIRSKSNVINVLQLSRFIKKKGFTIVHTHHYTSNLYGRIAAILAGTPIIMTYEHNLPVKEKWYHLLVWKILNLWTKGNVAVSNSIKGYREKHGIVSINKYKVIYNGIDLQRFNAKKQDIDKLKEDHGIYANWIVGTVGRLVDWKRFDLFLEAAAIVIKQRQDINFIIVGDGEKKEDLENHARLLGISEKVKFLGWQTNIENIYPLMNVFVITSNDDEGFGLVSVEAMASGVPIVAVQNHANQEIISKECGIIVERKPCDIAGAILKIVGDRSLSNYFSNNGIERAKELFNIDRTAEELSELYKKVLEGKR